MDVGGAPPAKRPVSVLVVIHTPQLEILLLERASYPGYWQSVTGSQEAAESLRETAIREVAEETGLTADTCRLTAWNLSNRFEIFPQWRQRYASGVTHNREHVFALEVDAARTVNLAADEHRSQIWLPWSEAADRVFSWSNRDAILSLGLAGH